MKRRILFAALVAVVVVAFTAPPVLAASTATVRGTVTGSDGAIPAARVQIDYLARGGLPKRTAIVQTAADGTWEYIAKAGDYRFTISAPGYVTHVEVRTLVRDTVTQLDTVLAVVPPPTGTIQGRITSATGVGLNGYAYFYKQNADGTWPTGYLAQVATAPDGTYSSQPLPLGVYKVRLFTVHTGVQWYRYVLTMDLATPVTLATAGQVVTGIDAIYPPP